MATAISRGLMGQLVEGDQREIRCRGQLNAAKACFVVTQREAFLRQR